MPDYSHPIMSCKSIVFFLSALMLSSGLVRAAGLPEDSHSAVAYAYFRVGDDTSDSPGINLDEFSAQIAEISAPENGYHPETIDTILKAQNKNSPLSDKTVHLTFEGTDSSFIRNAFPLLTRYNIPFTIFISPGLIDAAEKSGDSSVLSWNDIRKIAKSDLATIGMTSYSYAHIDGKTLESLMSDLNHARTIFREKLGQEPRFFSYPYGEYTPDFITAVSRQGFVAAFGQQSGAMGKSSSRLFLPRFTVTEEFSDIDRFRMTSSSLPLPVDDMEPPTPLITSNPPHPGFTVSKGIAGSDLKNLRCFASGIEKTDVQKIGDRHFEIRFSNGFEDSKGRLNCTIPVPPADGGDEPRWRWLGFQFIVPTN